MMVLRPAAMMKQRARTAITLEPWWSVDGSRSYGTKMTKVESNRKPLIDKTL